MHRVIAEVLTLDMSTIIWTLIFHKKNPKIAILQMEKQEI